MQQVEFLRRQLNRAGAHGYVPGAGVDFKVSHLDGLRLLLGRGYLAGTAQYGADVGDQNVRLERLGQIIVGSQLEPQHLVELAAAGRQENYRDASFIPEK